MPALPVYGLSGLLVPGGVSISINTESIWSLETQWFSSTSVQSRRKKATRSPCVQTYCDSIFFLICVLVCDLLPKVLLLALSLDCPEHHLNCPNCDCWYQDRKKKSYHTWCLQHVQHSVLWKNHKWSCWGMLGQLVWQRAHHNSLAQSRLDTGHIFQKGYCRSEGSPPPHRLHSNSQSVQYMNHHSNWLYAWLHLNLHMSVRWILLVKGSPGSSS